MFRVPNFCSRISCAFGSHLPIYRKGELAVNSNSWCRAILRCRRFASTSAVPTNGCCIVKLDTPEFYSIFSPELKKLGSIFHRYGYELRIVGGAVRDLLNGKKPVDVDFATTATPEQMKEMFDIENIRILHKKGEKHGTIATRVDDKENFEITTLRTDVSTDGRHAQVEFTTDWKIDASRRDLTINSMYLDLNGRVYDYFHGYEDLKNKRVVFVGDARKRIQEDYLRILRYFRFFGRIVEDPNTHDEYTLAAIRETASGLEKISGERIWSELSRILSGPFVLEIVQKMLHLGLGPYMGMGETEELDVPCFIRICQLSDEYAFKPISYIVALLRDENKVLHFHARVRLSGYERDLAQFITQYKSVDVSVPIATRLRLFQRIMAFTHIRKEHMREYITELLHFNDERELLTQFESWQLPTFPFDGATLKRQGIRSNKKIRIILDKLKDLWVSSDFQMTAEDLSNRLPDIISELNNNKM